MNATVSHSEGITTVLLQFNSIGLMLYITLWFLSEIASGLCELNQIKVYCAIECTQERLALFGGVNIASKFPKTNQLI